MKLVLRIKKIATLWSPSTIQEVFINLCINTFGWIVCDCLISILFNSHSLPPFHGSIIYRDIWHKKLSWEIFLPIKQTWIEERKKMPQAITNKKTTMQYPWFGILLMRTFYFQQNIISRRVKFKGGGILQQDFKQNKKQMQLTFRPHPLVENNKLDVNTNF